MRARSKSTPSTSMSVETTRPPSSTHASSPIPTATPRPAAPAAAAIAATRSSSDSMARNVPRAVHLPLYQPAGRRLNVRATAVRAVSEASADAGAFFVDGGASMTTTVAYPGEEGAYAAEAGARLYPDAELVSLKSWAEVVRAVGRGDAAYGVLPIENSLAGPIPETYDLLAHAPLAIVAETVLPVPHCLVGLPGTNIDALARVHSHPAALAQCRRFLSSLPDTLPEVAPSTAAAARRVAEAGDA